jgi:hypothetical protein
MKKLITLCFAMTSLVFSGLVLAAGSGLGIVGSPHDFTDDFSNEAGGAVAELAWNQREEICRVCHVPHDHNRATQYYLNGLLWNHAVSSATYTMYDSAWSSTLDGAQSPQPDGIAKLCLGCHDGTIAIDTFDKYAGTAGNEIQNIYGGGVSNFWMVPFTDGANLDLRGTHPLSIEYDTVADPNLRGTSTTMGTSGTIADVLDAGKVQCSSCHDVHDQESVAGTHLVRVAQSVAQGGTASGLCLTCHDK